MNGPSSPNGPVPKCLFCLSALEPGSTEHVFLAALGGRLTTKQALCGSCNNHFAHRDSGKIDDALSESLVLVRCALMIWTGRDRPPPTLRQFGRFENGSEYDLAPGGVPIPRCAPIPDFTAVKPGDVMAVHARDINDAKRILDIARKRGLRPVLHRSVAVETKAPRGESTINFDGPKTWRAIAKTAATGACVLFGNQSARARINPQLLSAIKTGSPNIGQYSGWDFVNPWPAVTSYRPHASTPGAELSGFEHSLLLVDVGDRWIAYVQLFGAFRLSACLGSRSGLPPKGMALNPRAFVPERFELTVDAPATYQPRHEASFREEQSTTLRGIEQSFTGILAAWEREAAHAHVDNLSKELAQLLREAPADDDSQTKVISKWTKRIAQLERGDKWEEELDIFLIDETTRR